MSSEVKHGKLSGMGLITPLAYTFISLTLGRKTERKGLFRPVFSTVPIIVNSKVRCP